MFQTVPEMLMETIARFPEKDVFRFRKEGKLQNITYSEFGEQIKDLTYSLIDLGITKGDKIAILSNNRPEWAIADFSIFSVNGVVVPIYQTLPPKQIEYILKDSDTRAIFVENELQLKKIEEIQKFLPKLEFIFSFEAVPDKLKSVILFEDLLQKGKSIKAENPDQFDKLIKSIKPSEICSIVYTSGTTGDPKGVMLHHKGFVNDIINSEAIFTVYSDDVFLSFLPLSHLYERLGGHWCPMYRGATIHYAQSIDTVVEDISEAKPTVMVSVPRLYEKVASKVKDQIEQSSSLKRKLFYWAIDTGLEYHEKRIEGTSSKWLEKRYRLADKIVFSKIKQKLGGNFRCPIAGGAPLSVETLKFFEAIGLRIIEGYGMTETHLIITLTPIGKTKYGSCGKPIEGVKVKIAKDGEVLVKGDTLMEGYYNQPDLTMDVIDKDGWLHTGDIGHLDEDNYLFLTDRKKNIIVTSGGKNIAPAPIEHILKTSRYIDDICLIGNKRKFISAVIIPGYESLELYAKENGIAYSAKEELTTNTEILNLIQKEIETLQADCARYESVKKFILLSEPLSIEKGELSPSLKIKRNVLEENYKKQIDALYAG